MATAEPKWIVTVDPKSKLPYFVHTETKAVVWELPEGEAVVGGQEAIDAAAAGARAAPVAASGTASGAGGAAGAGAGAAGIRDAGSAIKEGWMHKSDPKGKHWKKRFVVVNQIERTLTYYGEDPRRTLELYRVTPEAKGTINLVGAAVKRASEETASKAPTPACIELATPERTSFFCVRDASQVASWLSFIRIAAAGTFAGVDAPASALHAMVPRVGVAPAPKSGKLSKTAPDGRTWTDRWAELDPSTATLVYYDSEAKTQAKGLVHLMGASVHAGGGDSTLRELPTFTVSSTGREYAFLCNTAEELQEWLDLVFAAINAPPPAVTVAGKEGMLQKSDPKGRNWKTRFFTLSVAESSMAYFTAADKVTQKGAFSLDGTKLRVGSKEVSGPTVFTLTLEVPGGRTYHLCAEGVKTLVEWRDALLTVPGVSM